MSRTPSEHRAFVAGLKAALRLVRQEKLWFQRNGYVTEAAGAQWAENKLTLRIQRESRKLKAKGKKR